MLLNGRHIRPAPTSLAREGHRAVAPRLILGMAAMVAALVMLDQVVKWMVVEWIGPGAAVQRHEVIGRVLAFEYVENTGAAFGMLAGRPWVVSILSGLVLLAFAAGLVRDLRANQWMRAGMILILAGALGNMADRFRHGYVIDFIAVGIWPRFNLADTMITIGVVLMIALALLDASKAEA